MYVKSTEKTTTSIKLRLDRFIGEMLPDPPHQAKAHLLSVIGGDTQIAAISAAISLGDRFMIEGPEISPIRVCLERNAQCFKRIYSDSGAEEAFAPPHWHVGRIDFGKQVGQYRKASAGWNRQTIHLGFPRPEYRGFRNGRTGSNGD
jgi:hypothetical protein